MSCFPVSCYNTELATWLRSCVTRYLECEGVVYFCVNVWDLVLFAIGSLVFWIVLVGCKFAVSLLDLVRLALGS